MKFFQWRFLLVTLGMLSCFSNVQGLKCYVCGVWNCNFYIHSWQWDLWPDPYFFDRAKEFLVECQPGAISCATLSVKTDDPYSIASPVEQEIWFQRICLYPGVDEE